MIDDAGIFGMDPSFTNFGVYERSLGAHIIKTEPKQGVSEESDTVRRVSDIMRELRAFTDRATSAQQIWYVEAPILHLPQHMGAHTYQLGHLMCSLHSYAETSTSLGFSTTILQVARHTVVKQLFALERTVKKAELPKLVEDKYGERFTEDRGLDKLHAWLQWRYGVGCLAGEWSYYSQARRGDKQRGKPRARRTIQLIDP